MKNTNDAMTWAALLARYAEYARASVALPDEGEGGRWKRVTPQVITLHAVSMALGELDCVSDEDRALALDKAEILCREAAVAIHEAWTGEPVPEGLTELIQDSRIAFESAANAGVEWLVGSERLEISHPGDLAERLIRAGFGGDLFMVAPGQPVFRGAPAAFARARGGAAPEDEHVRAIERSLRGGGGQIEEATRIGTPRQVYRQIDFFAGGPVKDLVVPMNEPIPPGQPMLVLVIEGGEACAVPLPPPGGPRLETLPVEILCETDPEEPSDQGD